MNRISMLLASLPLLLIPILQNGVAASSSRTATQPATMPLAKRFPVLALLWNPQREGVTVPSSALVERQLFGPAQSVTDYYQNQSRHKVSIEKAGFYGWFDARFPAAHYWDHPKDTTCGFDNGHVEKWTEAIRFADATFDFAKYDLDKNGVLDPQELGVIVFIPQNEPFGTVRGTAGQLVPESKPLVVDGVQIPAVSEVYLGSTPHFGVLAHELGHLIFNLPDMYGAPLPAATYSLMDASYGDWQLDPYNKYRLGWLIVREITQSGEYSVSDIQQSGEVLKILRPKHPQEFFLIENREKGVYDSAIADPGIGIWRIQDNQEGDWGRTNIAMIRRVMPVDDQQANWHATDKDPQPELELVWADGTKSGIKLTRFSKAGPSMTLEVHFPK